MTALTEEHPPSSYLKDLANRGSLLGGYIIRISVPAPPHISQLWDSIAPLSEEYSLITAKTRKEDCSRVRGRVQIIGFNPVKTAGKQMTNTGQFSNGS